MRRKLFLLLTGVLVALWSQTGLAWCGISNNGTGYGQVFNSNVILNQHRPDAGEGVIEDYNSKSDVFVICNNDGGWFELSITGALVPASVGNGVIKTDIDFIGVSITAEVLNANASGLASTVLTDGSFTTRRWDIPRISGSESDRRAYKVAESVLYQFWAIGPEDPKSGRFGTRDIVTLTASGGGDYPVNDKQVIFGFGNRATAIASCYIDTSALYFAMPETKTTAFKEPGLLKASGEQQTTRGGINCDRDVNVQFTLSATDTVPGLPNVLAPEPGGAEGVGATFRYHFYDADGGGKSEPRDLTLAESFNLLDGPTGEVRRTYFYLTAYYYRFGEEVKAGHFRSTATLNVHVQ
ncbi:TPA: fimbrial protein [Citrobacter pasteurii]